MTFVSLYSTLNLYCVEYCNRELVKLHPELFETFFVTLN